jgi:hypothetical protein
MRLIKQNHLIRQVQDKSLRQKQWKLRIRCSRPQASQPSQGNSNISHFSNASPPFSLQLSVQLHYKADNGQNFHQIANTPALDVCFIFGNPVLAKWPFLENCIENMPELCHKCPYPNGTFTFSFVTNKDNPRFCPQGIVARRAIFDVNGGWPDGDYKSVLKIFNDKDPEGLVITYYFKVKLGDKNIFK